MFRTGLTAAALAMVLATGAVAQDAKPEAWIVVAIGAKPLEGGNLPLVEFRGDGKVGGFSGCNSFFGELEAATAVPEPEGDLRFSDGIGVTRMACPDAMMKTEDDFLHALTKVKRYERTGVDLLFFDADGNAVLTLKRTS